MRDHLTRMLRYDRWATGRITGAMATADVIDTKALELLAHMYWVQQLWLARAGGPFEAPVDWWALKHFDACVADAPEMSRSWIAYLQEAGADHPVRYANSKGEAFTNTLGEIATHVANHGTHHRAQISAILREQGIAPPPTDFIFYLREMGAGDS